MIRGHEQEFLPWTWIWLLLKFKCEDTITHVKLNVYLIQLHGLGCSLIDESNLPSYALWR